jgi:hypothetical protein
VGCSDRDGFQVGEHGEAQSAASLVPGISQGILDVRLPTPVRGAVMLLI